MAAQDQIPNRIYVGGMTPRTTELDLIHLFSNHGNVTDANIITDSTGVSKGYGFVTFKSKEDANRIIKLNGRICWNGRQLTIAPARANRPLNQVTPIERAEDYPCLQTVCENGVNYLRYKGTAYFNVPTTALPHAPTPVCENGVRFYRHKGVAYFNIPPAAPSPPPSVGDEIKNNGCN